MEPSGVLNGELYARDEGAYNDVANDLVRLPDSRKRILRPIVATICGNIIDASLRQRGMRRAARKWRSELVESWASAYIFCVSESWETFDRDRAGELMKQGLRGELALRMRIGSEAISLTNQDNRCTCTIVGFERLFTLENLGGTIVPSEDEPWVPFYQYVKAQPSYERIEQLRCMYDVVARAFVKDKHYEAFLQVARPAWAIGVGTAIVDILGEVPSQPSPG